jgi:hypothetical protein
MLINARDSPTDDAASHSNQGYFEFVIHRMPQNATANALAAAALASLSEGLTYANVESVEGPMS